MFTEANPDKGTETLDEIDGPLDINNSLQKLTPIRGRKPDSKATLATTLTSLQKLTPIRGRKPYCI